LVLKRGAEFDLLNDGINEDANYWIGIHKLTRFTFMKPQNFIINFVRSSGFSDFTIFQDFHVTNAETSKYFIQG